MELDKTKHLIEKFAKSKSISVQNAWDIFFFDEILFRLSKSKFKNKFVFKGGFYLQSLIGVESRTTMDLDFKLIGSNIDDGKLKEIFENICSQNVESNIVFKIISINEITAETRYGGKTIKIEARYFNIRKMFGIDIGFGDVITPRPINYSYRLSYHQDECPILAYPVETSIAEKFETLISKGTNNSRSKDLLDLYLYSKQPINENVLNAAMINTFNLRKTAYSKDNVFETLEKVFSNERIQSLFENYKNKHSFAQNISYDDCKDATYKICSMLIFTSPIKLSNYGIKLTLVRHGESDEHFVGGWSNSSLTENGRREIEDLRDLLLEKYDKFISSDLPRAIETSNIINKKTQMKIEYDSLFREVNNGDFKNMTLIDFKHSFTSFSYSSLKINQNYPNGESPIGFFSRVKDEFIKTLDNNKNENILVVTHYGVITAIMCLLNGWPYSNLLKIAPNTGKMMIFNE